MTDDILAQAEKICKVLSEVSQHWRNQSNAVLVVAGDLLPQLLAEAKQLAVEMKAALAQIEALKDKLAEERAKILMAGEDEVAEAWEYLKDNPNFINDAYQQLKADPDLQKAGVVWDRPTPWAARRKAGSPGRYAKETEDVEMDSMTDDILAQAEVLLKNQPKWRILASEDAEDVKSLIELMPQLLAEANRQKALNPFQVDVSTAMRLGDNEFVYGDKKSLDLCENRIRDRDAWKAKAIGERAINLVESHDDICVPCENCQCGYQFEICPAKDYFLQKAARELEEEMKDAQNMSEL